MLHAPWSKWFPWRFFVRRIARAHGFLDPIALFTKLQRFAQPAEVAESTELLRAGVVFHARGLVNTKAVQHNLDWLWPYWIRRQFDPRDPSFLPRAFSITHVNLTHRNWTAVGIPGVDWFPIVDERGLLMPFWDSWSLDAWVLDEDWQMHYPLGGVHEVHQVFHMERITGVPVPEVETLVQAPEFEMRQLLRMELKEGRLSCRLHIDVQARKNVLLVVSLRPCNPEGVSFVEQLELDEDAQNLTVNNRAKVSLRTPLDGFYLSSYHEGDVLERLVHQTAAPKLESRTLECKVGMATAALCWRVEGARAKQIDLEVLNTEKKLASGPETAQSRWRDALESHASLQIPDEKLSYLFQTAVRTLVLLSPEAVYPGPYTYRRFWCRDAAYMAYALLCCGLTKRIEAIFPHFLRLQTKDGHFCSQDGEWDSNGQVLWIISRYFRSIGRSLTPELQSALVRAVDWLDRKRVVEDGSRHAGLLPPGFSAEHLGPNDYYYWDDAWGIAGLLEFAELLRREELGDLVRRTSAIASALRAATARSIGQARVGNKFGAIPASPYRRMDSGAVGSLALDYPTQILPPADEGLMATVDFLRRHCSIDQVFFQDMIHSGLNAYLTLHIAQCMLRAGDRGCFALLQRVAQLASETGQWPEAIHPHTGGGCMGDGQHGWAAAEFVLFLRNMFVREEADELRLFAGIPKVWLSQRAALRFGPTFTPFGSLSVALDWEGEECVVSVNAEFHTPPARLLLELPDVAAREIPRDETTLRFRWSESD